MSVALNPIWNGGVIFVISVSYTVNMPFGEPLLRDGFALVSSAIGTENFGHAQMPDVTGSMQVLVQSTPDTDSLQCPIFLVMHCWHKDREGRIGLGADLVEEPSLVNSITPALENLMYGSLQQSAYISDALQAELEVMASRKTVFQVRYLSG